MTQASAGAGRRGRGRPPRLSRAQIVEAAVELAARDPAVPVTVKRVAAAVGAAPMALYRYFPDHDALLQAAADHVLATGQRAPIPDGPWPDRLRTWMRRAQDRLRSYHQLLPYMAAAESLWSPPERHAAAEQPVGLASLSGLAEILRPAGLAGGELALAITLVHATVIGYASYEGHRPPVERTTALLGEALDRRPAEEAAALGEVLAGLPAAYARLYATILDETVRAVERLARPSG